MSVIQVEAQVTSEELLKAIRQLSRQELEQLFDQIVELRSGNAASRLSLTESELMAKINQPIAADRRRRYHELLDKRRAQQITEAEYEELLRLTDEVEQGDAKRVQCLVELARLRNLSVDELLSQMGIRALPYE